MHITTFIHQKSYEHIVHMVRRHPITFMPALGLFVLLFLLPVPVYVLLSRFLPSIIIGELSYPLLVLGGSIYYLSILIFFYSYFIDFYLDVLVVTNDRLIDIEQIGIFARSVSEVELHHIQDITSEVRGVFASLFNYGKLSVQTAGAVEKFIVPDIYNPERLRREILDLAEKDRQRHNKNVMASEQQK